MASNSNHRGTSGGIQIGSAWFQRKINLRPQHRGVHLVTEEILRQMPELGQFSVGLCHVQSENTKKFHLTFIHILFFSRSSTWWCNESDCGWSWTSSWGDASEIYIQIDIIIIIIVLHIFECCRKIKIISSSFVVLWKLFFPFAPVLFERKSTTTCSGEKRHRKLEENCVMWNWHTLARRSFTLSLSAFSLSHDILVSLTFPSVFLQFLFFSQFPLSIKTKRAETFIEQL